MADTPGNSGRAEKSLGLLTTRFVTLLQEAKDGVLDLKLAADTLAVRQKRRIYDITNVLEGIGLIEKRSKNSIQWKGVGPGCNTTEISNRLVQLKSEILELERREMELDQHKSWVQQSIRNVTDDEVNHQLAYVTHDDICRCFEGETLLAIQAPSGTQLEVPIPETSYNQKPQYQIHLKSHTGPIYVLLVNKDTDSTSPVVVQVPPPKDNEAMDVDQSTQDSQNTKPPGQTSTFIKKDKVLLKLSPTKSPLRTAQGLEPTRMTTRSSPRRQQQPSQLEQGMLLTLPETDPFQDAHTDIFDPMKSGLQSIAELLQVDPEVICNTIEQHNIAVRRYACMVLATMTNDDEGNKTLLCSMKGSMQALVALLQSPTEDLHHLAATVLRSLSWKANPAIKKALQEVGAATALMLAAMGASKESTLKCVLSALWNMSAHSSENKADICAVEGALAFLVICLTFKSHKQTLAIMENGGGILRNISSHIAASDRYRTILRQHGCLPILLSHLQSHSVTIVSNACGTLWNLSARCPEDQKALCEMGAANLLRHLMKSKHKMIATVSASTLKNLLTALSDLGHVEDEFLVPTNTQESYAHIQRTMTVDMDLTVSQTCSNLENLTYGPTKGVDQMRLPSRITAHQDLEHFNIAKSLPQPVFMNSDSPSIVHRNDSTSHCVSGYRNPDCVVSSPSVLDCSASRVHNLSMGASWCAQEKPVDLRWTSYKQDKDVCGGFANVRCSGQSQIYKPNDQNSTVYNNPNINAMFCRSNVPHKSERINYTSQKIDTLHLDLREQDQPIDYSMKYPLEPERFNHPTKPTAMARPMPRYQNQQAGDTISTLSVNLSDKHKAGQSIEGTRSYSAYAETDLDQDLMDQPTNFSMRYIEQDDYIHVGQPVNYSTSADQPINYCTHVEQPINYSTRFQEPEALSRSEHNSQPQAMRQSPAVLEEDLLQTFYTEDTPMAFLSNATSMSDLSAKAENGEVLSERTTEDDDRPSPKDTAVDEQQVLSRCSDSEILSGTGTHSSTGYTVIARNQACENGGPLPSNRHPAREAPAPCLTNSDPPSLYSYNDSASTSSPSDRTRSYCTEDTPYSFSRRSSLSSLHSADATETKENSHTLIQDVDETNISSADVTLKPDLCEEQCESVNTSTNTSQSGPGKSVTFDDSHHVYDTPMMFSRCSSLGSLSSFDAYSVHSSVNSEHSRRASEVVSPSELPDSPSDTMPHSPSQCKSPPPFDDGHAQSTHVHQKNREDKHMKLDTIPEKAEINRQTIHGTQHILKDNIQTYADEGSPNDENFSCATSLSALTFDDEPAILMDPGLRRVPVGQEMDPVATDLHAAEPLNGLRIHNYDEDNSSVSEGEEHFLENFIRIAMPTKQTNSKKKKKKNSHGLESTGTCVSSQKARTFSVTSSDVLMENFEGEHCCLVTPIKPVTKIQGVLMKQHEMLDICDSPRKFATEGTPLKYSRAESLSDISMDSTDGTAIDKTMDTVIDVQARKQSQIPVCGDENDDHSDVSSISDDDEELLSEAIKAAMPKSDKKKPRSTTKNRKAPKSKTKDQLIHLGSTALLNSHHVGDCKMTASHVLVGDSVRTFAVEDTPISLSHATSLSDLTVADMPVGTDGDYQDTVSALRATDQNSNHHSHDPQTPLVQEEQHSLDSMKIFGIEGTPMIFSRNDSLDSLSCDDVDLIDNKMSFVKEVGEFEPERLNNPSRKGRITNIMRDDSETAAIAQLETPGKPLSYHGYGPSSTSTPLTKKNASPVILQNTEDQPRTFVTEDTPMCFSRNSSLSSLNSHDHDNTCMQHHFQPVPLSKDNGTNYKVEDTPANLSGNSSLSALSVESLSFDATPSEGDLLEECINSALPKSRKKGSTSHDNSSKLNAVTSSNKRTARAMLFVGTPVTDDAKKTTAVQKPQISLDLQIDTGLVTAVTMEPSLKAHSENLLDEEKHEKLQSKRIMKTDDNPCDGVVTSNVGVGYTDPTLSEAIQEVESNVSDCSLECKDPADGLFIRGVSEIVQACSEKVNLFDQCKVVNGNLSKSVVLSVDSVTIELEKVLSPDANSTLTPDTMLPYKDNLPSVDEESADTTVSSTMADITVIDANSSTVGRSMVKKDSSSDQSFDEDDISAAEQNESDVGSGLDTHLENETHTTNCITAEEEIALENEDNNISELSAKRKLFSSLSSSEELIENEMSLVSNDYSSIDTVSQESIILSSISIPGLTSFEHLDHEHVKCDIVEFKPISPTHMHIVGETDVPKQAKKQNVSKIAGLWRKDQKKSQNCSQLFKDKRSSSNEGETKSSMGSLRRLFKLGKSKKEKSKHLATSNDDLLYAHSKETEASDKLSLKKRSRACEVFSSVENVSISLDVTGEESQKRLWRSTHTIGALDHLSSDQLSLCDDEQSKKTSKKNKGLSLNLWKRPTVDDDPHNASNTSKMGQHKKKGFSFRRRDAKCKIFNVDELETNDGENNKENQGEKAPGYLVTAV